MLALTTFSFVISCWFIFCEGQGLEERDGASFEYSSGQCGIATDQEDVENHIRLPQYVVEIGEHGDVPSTLLATYKYGLHGFFENKRSVLERTAAISPASFPWIAQVRFGVGGPEPYSTFVCSAAILSSKFLLTSAVCIGHLPLAHLMIRVGEYTETKIDEHEKTYFIEEVFSTSEEALGSPKDIALIKIKPDESGAGITFSEDVLPVCLPTANTPYLNGLYCSVGGFTDLSSDEKILNVEKVPLSSKSSCEMKGEFYTKGMICGGRIPLQKNKCPVNAGSPLVCKINGRTTLIGIKSLYGCGSDTTPSSFADIQHHLKWIANAMKNFLNN